MGERSAERQGRRRLHVQRHLARWTGDNLVLDHSQPSALRMIVVGLPYSFQGQSIVNEVTGGSPYGATTIAAGDGSRQPSENELAGAQFQGELVARTAQKMFG